MVPNTIKIIPIEPMEVRVLALSSIPRLRSRIPMMKSPAPLLRMRTLAACRFSSRTLLLCFMSSHCLGVSIPASHRGHTERVPATGAPHWGHLRVCAMPGRVGPIQPFGQWAEECVYAKLFTMRYGSCSVPSAHRL